MSGGFFRGTSAEQDTRFSNKQAKLLKSQKFAPELEHMVDTTKVKMDVMRPWIANRVTELLGFEDEVLINFIYGLLDGKEVNGKEIQISLTGFMEKNTGKFMKELWTLLLSAQKNVSGVPQQFLDAKEEETRKKKAETDRISSEIQKKKEKEGRELEQEKMRKMDGEDDISRANNTNLEPSSQHQLRTSHAHYADEKDTSERNGSRGMIRKTRSPHSADRTSSSPRDRHRSRSLSKSPHPRRRSISSDRVYRSPPRRSVTPRRRYSPRRSLSPARRLSSYSRRRSTSRSYRRSPSPIRHRLRSPIRRRSRSPIRRRSPTPVRRRSITPMRYRSRSPMRKRSPSAVRRRYYSPVRRRSPSRSPSPARRRYRRSPSTPQRRSLSPVRRRSPIPSQRRLLSPAKRRSPSPEEWSSPSPVRRQSPSPGMRRSPKHQSSPVHSPRGRIRIFEHISPVRHARATEIASKSAEIQKEPDSVVRRPLTSLRSPQRDPREQDNSHKKASSSSPSPYRSESPLESPPGIKRRSPSEDRRSYSPHESPLKKTVERRTRDNSASPPQKPRYQRQRNESLETGGKEEENNYSRDNGDQKLKSSGKKSAYSLRVDEHKDSFDRVRHKDESPERTGRHQSNEIQSHADGLELRKKDQEIRSEKISRRLPAQASDQQRSPTVHKISSPNEMQRMSYHGETHKTDEKNHTRSKEFKGSKLLDEMVSTVKSTRKVDEKDRSSSLITGSQESDKYRPEIHERRKHKRSRKQDVASDDSDDDSEIEDRKEAKKRRKEEKRLRKEERRRRREERRRRKEERRAEKLKAKSVDIGTPPSDRDASDGEQIVRMESGAGGAEEAESEQKKLEIELRKKALESLRAKKGIGH
ncbi:uncharacterized protein LOC127808031 isoform X2 [Diospyros lotus]|uniref:uncharacterized protein LOC127808031 isoform X2 n=1 Tax=Diospyros lotus TaxID=55363 RepID=UPI0022512887|nr:uncharacterized protein LOC127808031 isoform X2 [Diospyros lotus]